MHMPAHARVGLDRSDLADVLAFDRLEGGADRAVESRLASRHGRCRAGQNAAARSMWATAHRA
jgi:hypothetical protein